MDNLKQTTKVQKEVIADLQQALSNWSFSRDIQSPTHSGDLREELRKRDISRDKIDKITGQFKQIIATVKNI